MAGASSAVIKAAITSASAILSSPNIPPREDLKYKIIGNPTTNIKEIRAFSFPSGNPKFILWKKSISIGENAASTATPAITAKIPGPMCFLTAKNATKSKIKTMPIIITILYNIKVMFASFFDFVLY